MTILLDAYRQPEPSNTLKKFCLDCPQEFRFERSAGSYRINRELQAHWAICPGRQARPRRAARSLGKRRIQSRQRGVIKLTYANRFSIFGYHAFYAN
jgi:hypothetical protein